MLHILLLVLKIIGIILAVIVGILLLLLGIVLFVPIRYEISAKCDGTIESLKAKVKATWLLHLVQADVLLKGKKLKWKVRLAWLNKTNAAGEINRKEEKADETRENGSQKVEKTVVKDEVSEETPESAEEECKNSEEENKEHQLEENHEEYSEASETTSQESEKESVSDKIKTLIEKIKKIIELLTDEAHIRAVKKIKKELFVLLKRLKPKKINLKLRFGFEDPALTGKVLGGLAMIYPWLGESAEICPDFENQILKGSVYLKGRIRICHFVSLALKLLLCKDVRTSYKDIRNFKL